MTEIFNIAGYCRISVDEELDRDNVSIENQKSIIKAYVESKFPGSGLTLYEDRDRSGYNFEREEYQKLRKALMDHKHTILIVKDFSRFSRRNSRGLVELEDLRDAGVRIISIGDNVDFPNDDDWLKIQFQFLINEMPVTDTSKKVKAVVKRRQESGNWICAAPYGYIVNKHQQFEIVPTEAEIIRSIFGYYLTGWGYKKIANHLTAEGIPTPRMSEQMRKEAEGLEYKRETKPAWAIATIQGILDDDFYIGTLRQGKTTRKKINGKQMERPEKDIWVFENHHQPIIDYRTFALVREQRQQRSRSNYRGVKKYDNVYSGLLRCGDCGSPMFAMSRPDLKDAYRCGLYHRLGAKACSSHHIRVERLDELVKCYIQMVMDNSSAMLEQLNRDLARQDEDLSEAEQASEHLEEVLEQLENELKVMMRQRIRDIAKHPDEEDEINARYEALEEDQRTKIKGLQKQIDLTADKRNTIIRVNRAAKLAMDVFRDILEKPKLERRDLELIIEWIKVYEDHIEVKLKPDIDALLHTRTLETAGNFRQGIADIEGFRIVQQSFHRLDKVYDVNVVTSGDPLQTTLKILDDGIIPWPEYCSALLECAKRVCSDYYIMTKEAATTVCI